VTCVYATFFKPLKETAMLHPLSALRKNQGTLEIRGSLNDKEKQALTKYVQVC